MTLLVASIVLSLKSSLAANLVFMPVGDIRIAEMAAPLLQYTPSQYYTLLQYADR